MLTRAVSRLSPDFAHKQVSNGFSKKYGQNFDKIFRQKKPDAKTLDSSHTAPKIKSNEK